MRTRACACWAAWTGMVYWKCCRIDKRAQAVARVLLAGCLHVLYHEQPVLFVRESSS
jgi:hypothetical protein